MSRTHHQPVDHPRNAWGFPIPGTPDAVDPIVPITGPHDDCACDSWAESLPSEEAASLLTIQDRVAHAMRGYLSEVDCQWAAEETLWQIVALLRRTGSLHLPEIGRLEVVSLAQGPALIAVASPGLKAGDTEGAL